MADEKKEKKDTKKELDGILETERAATIRKYTDPESPAQGRLAAESAPAFGVFNKIMDKVEQLREAEFQDIRNLRNFTLDDSIKSKLGREITTEIVKASAGVGEARAKAVLKTIENMNRPQSPFGMLGNILGGRMEEAEEIEEVPKYE